ncbi:MAG: GTPase domain-containing protein [Gammaproteobacteria bacterium]|nr:GTPase domain-containing protein [Gammaproteobacteria bacterium]MCK5091781.1 GTPase domain-containing protein [Gammaproteobacteria bacterium]
MSEFNEKKNKITLKLVYYGPALSGKTTNLMSLHDILSPELKGEMMVLETKDDRTLFFDLLPMGITAPSGLLIKLKLFTVPGQVAHDSTRKAVLSRADGVVFVADSQKTQSINNAESFENLVGNIARVGLDIEKLPLVVQFNKRDLSDILTEDEIRTRWKDAHWPLLFSTALQGSGVEETLSELLSLVYDALDEEYGLNERHNLDKDLFVSGVTGCEFSKAVNGG